MKKTLYFLLGIWMGWAAVTEAQTLSTTITPRGATFPNLALSSTTDVSVISAPAPSQLVYNTNPDIAGSGADGTGFYFWDTSRWKKLATGPIVSGGGSLPASGIVLSETENNTSLINNGFTLNAQTILQIQAYDPNNPQPIWLTPVSYGANAPASINIRVEFDGKLFVMEANGVSKVYTPLNNTWTTIATAPANVWNRTQPFTGWTGSEIIIYGGRDAGGANAVNGGARYNPTTNTWTQLSTTNQPTARTGPSHLLTPTKLIVLGGFEAANFNTYLGSGGIYDLTTNTWSVISGAIANAPAGRLGINLAWTGTEVIAWGGIHPSTADNINTGARFNPTANTWTTMATSGAPLGGRFFKDKVVGNYWILQGGVSGSSGDLLTTGIALYNFTTNAWSFYNYYNFVPRRNPAATWLGNKLYIWGGVNFSNFYQRTGDIFDADTHSWNFMAINNSPTTWSVNTGNWSVNSGNRWLVNGSIYNTATDNWLTPGYQANQISLWGTIALPPDSFSQYNTSESLTLGSTTLQPPTSAIYYLFKKN